MSHKKSLIAGLLVLLSLIILTGCGGNDMRTEKSLTRLSQIEQDNIRDISLTIYYMDPNIFTLFPYDVDDVIGAHEYKLVINGARLKGHIDLLKQMGNADLIPVEPDDFMDVRIYYVFENKKGENIFDVAMWGDLTNLYVNGIEVEENDIFYDVLLLFLPDDAAERVKKIYIKYVKRVTNQQENSKNGMNRIKARILHSGFLF